MKEKIQLLIKNEGLTQSRLAEILEIQPANISHIISGRSKPGFELLQKILRRFPTLNPDWLLLDSEQMYREETNEVRNLSSSQQNVESSSGFKPAPNFDSLFSDSTSASGTASAKSGDGENLNVSSSQKSYSYQEVERVVVLFRDGSFQSYKPRE